MPFFARSARRVTRRVRERWMSVKAVFILRVIAEPVSGCRNCAQTKRRKYRYICRRARGKRPSQARACAWEGAGAYLHRHRL